MYDIWEQKIFVIGKFVLTVGKLAGVILTMLITWSFLTLFKKYLIHKKHRQKVNVAGAYRFISWCGILYGYWLFLYSSIFLVLILLYW